MPSRRTENVVAILVIVALFFFLIYIRDPISVIKAFAFMGGAYLILWKLTEGYRARNAYITDILHALDEPEPNDEKYGMLKVMASYRPDAFRKQLRIELINDPADERLIEAVKLLEKQERKEKQGRI